jgi:hypothetical protein
MLQISPPRIFQLEPKYANVMPEPDIFTIWAGHAFWVEMQRNTFSEKVWLEKLARYEELFRSGIWRQQSWQPPGDQKVFPYILILSESRVPLPNGLLLPVLQSRTITALITESKTPATKPV